MGVVGKVGVGGGVGEVLRGGLGEVRGCKSFVINALHGLHRLSYSSVTSTYGYALRSLVDPAISAD